jgi:hypothetical protein
MTINKLVKRILETQPDTRSSDKKLLLAIWEVQGFGMSDNQRRIFLDRCSPAASITRARRDYREELGGSEEVEEERFNKFQQYKNNAAVSWL